MDQQLDAIASGAFFNLPYSTHKEFKA